MCDHVTGGGGRYEYEQPSRNTRGSRAEESRAPEWTERQRSDALALARRLKSRAVRDSETQIARGRRVSGANQQLLAEASEVVAKLRGASIEAGGQECDEKPNADAFAPYNGDTIYICPHLSTRKGRNADREVIYILVHEAAHLWGERDEGAADEIAGMILGYALE
jgi:hypothetical protein